VRPQGYSFHVVKFTEDGLAQAFQDVQQSNLWINGGYFVFRREIFDYLDEGEDLVTHAFARLMAEGQLVAYPYEGFWAPMDTLKERDALEAMLESGNAPWTVWERKTAPSDSLRKVS
jgi:glucose-1-phosphate cytidylyltransferase